VKYLVCYPNHDPECWIGVDAVDAEHAATSYAEQLCSRDCECYSTFAGGDDLLVKVVGGYPQRFEVMVESVPHFHARAK